jgi:hypothetical protein
MISLEDSTGECFDQLASYKGLKIDCIYKLISFSMYLVVMNPIETSAIVPLVT